MVVAVVIIILMILLFIYVVWKVSSRKRKGRLLKIDDKSSDKKKDSPIIYKKIEDGISNPVTEKLDINSISFDIEDKFKSNKEKYYDDLNDERWKRKREKILKIHSYRCPCGSRENLQIHHKYYNKYPDGSWARAWDYPDNALMVLCDDCHKKYHKNHKSPIYYRKMGVHYEKV